MAQSIRRLGLKCLVALLRLLTREPSAGWRRSNRVSTLKGA